MASSTGSGRRQFASWSGESPVTDGFAPPPPQEMKAYEVPRSGMRRRTIHRCACAGLLVNDLAVDLDAKPSASRRFRVARRRHSLGGLLAERHHERVVGVVVGARPILHHGGRKNGHVANGLPGPPRRAPARPLCGPRTGPRRTRARSLPTPGCAGAPRPGSRSRRRRARRPRGRGRGGRGGAGITAAPPRRHQEHGQQARAGRARPVAGGERDARFR